MMLLFILISITK